MITPPLPRAMALESPGRRISRRWLTPLAIAALLSTWWMARPAAADVGATILIGAQPVDSAQRVWVADGFTRMPPQTVRISAGSCDASPDSVVMLEGTVNGDTEPLLTAALLPLGKPAVDLSAASALSGVVTINPVTLRLPDVVSSFVFHTFSVNAQVYRPNGFPGITSFTVCGR